MTINTIDWREITDMYGYLNWEAVTHDISIGARTEYEYYLYQHGKLVDIYASIGAAKRAAESLVLRQS